MISFFIIKNTHQKVDQADPFFTIGSSSCPEDEDEVAEDVITSHVFFSF